jgi:N-formylglutamate amidohydrolase
MQPGPTMFKPYVLTEPAGRRVPVILTSPHSGRFYPQEFLAASRLNALAIRRSEDSFVEELFDAGPSFGMPLLAATFPRAFCDANREAWELDPAMFEDRLPDYVNSFSPRVAMGLGTIARIVATGEAIYRRKLRFAEAEERIAGCWRPFHDALQLQIEIARQEFGGCLVIDCHSMPRAAPEGAPGRHANVILGDGYGTACAPKVTAFVETALQGLGLTVGRNDPYAGGHITRHYGQPRNNVHVLQIEVARALYMDERRIEKRPEFTALRERLRAFLEALAETARFLLTPQGGWGLASAAE